MRILLIVFIFALFTAAVSVNCPEINPKEPDILPDRYNCTRFYICDSGTPMMQHCAGGLYFNPQLKVCDRPENVVFCEYDDILYIKPHCDRTKYITCDYGNLIVRDCVTDLGFGLSASVEVSDYFEPCQQGSY